MVGGAICPLAPSYPSLPDIRIARIRLFSSTPLLLRSSILTIREKNARVHLWQEPIWHYRAHMSTESASIKEEKSNAILPYRKTKKSNLCSFWQLVKCKTCRTFVHFTAKCEQRQPLIFIKLR